MPTIKSLSWIGDHYVLSTDDILYRLKIVEPDRLPYAIDDGRSSLILLSNGVQYRLDEIAVNIKTIVNIDELLIYLDYDGNLILARTQFCLNIEPLKLGKIIDVIAGNDQLVVFTENRELAIVEVRTKTTILLC